MGEHCRACRAGLEHCHGTLIHHLLRGTECTEDGCAGAGIVPHTFEVDCQAVGCACAVPVQAIGSALDRAASATGVASGSG